MEQVYIYVSDQYGADPYLTTLEQFRADLAELFKNGEMGSPPELRKRYWHKSRPPEIVDERGMAVLVPATLNRLSIRTGVFDPAGLLGWAIAQDLYKLIQGHLEKRVSYGELRRAVEVYKEVTE